MTVSNIFQIRKLLAAVICCVLFFSISCSKDNAANEYLIQVRDRQVTLLEFQQAVESASKEAFPGERKIDTEAMNQLRVQVLNELTEDLIIMERGAELGISVSDAEIDQALAAIKADYPDNTFEETLLESAISLEEWKSKLADRLMVEKVVKIELIDRVKLTPDDISQHYQSLNDKHTGEEIDSDEQNEKMVRQLRRLKAQAAYQPWIDALRQQYQVAINQKQLQKLVGKQ